jgi:uncharacterized protein (DUF302 family)
MRMFASAVLLALMSGGAFAEVSPERDGWRVIDTDLAYQALIDAVKTATEANMMRVVTETGPTEAAAKLGTIIPGNRVLGVFNPNYAIRILPLSTAAMIEAPIRFYVTEDADGTATLSWKTPSFVFSPYADEGGADLAAIATELDAKFEAIAAAATAD